MTDRPNYRECGECASKPGAPMLCEACLHNRDTINRLVRETEELRAARIEKPVPMLLWCPGCNTRHVDVGDFTSKPHHTHACQGCGMVWRPSIGPTVGVRFLPGFKDQHASFVVDIAGER